MTTTIKTIEHLKRWTQVARDIFDDPAESVCVLCFRWIDRPESYRGEDLVCGNFVHDMLDLWIGPDLRDSITFKAHAGEQDISADGELQSFGAERIAPGVWALTPSLNIPGVLHGFVILTGVPEPAPFTPGVSRASRIWQPGDPVIGEVMS